MNYDLRSSPVEHVRKPPNLRLVAEEPNPGLHKDDTFGRGSNRPRTF
jgi:hypothetical protein